MAKLTYDDFKNRLCIQDILVDAGYTLNKRDGLRYPSYVRLDNEGRRIRGDKFIVTANGQCCFQPPTQRNYNIIGFIKEHPEKFAEYTPGMDKDRLVNLVCNRLLNNPIEDRETKIVNPKRDIPPFRIEEYKLHQFEGRVKDSQKPFYPYFKPRGINLSTQYAFRRNFVLAERTTQGGHVYKNLAFPMYIPGKDDAKVVGFEERSRRKLDGTSYKGMAPGSNAREGMWLASPNGTKLQDAKRVIIFESAYDAMAFYQMVMDKDGELTKEDRQELANSVFASTGGNPSARQFEGLMRTAKDATFHLGFDNDEAGIAFTEQFKALSKRENIPEGRIIREEPPFGHKDFNDWLLAHIEYTQSPLNPRNVPDEYKDYVESFRKHQEYIPSVKALLHPNDMQYELLPKPMRNLYAKYESLYEDAYVVKHSPLVAPCDKESAFNAALEAHKDFKEALCKALNIQCDDSKIDLESEAEVSDNKIQHDVDYTTGIDGQGNVEMEVETSDQEEKRHFHR